jgi:hypothetical protein
MQRWLISLVCLGVCVVSAVTADCATGNASQVAQQSSPNVNVVIQWNRALLVIVRIPGAQSPTVHPTRSFAILHAAIYDAVNAIDREHAPYLVRLSDVSRFASQDAAAASAAHEVLVALYPAFQAKLDSQLQESLAVIPEGADKAEGISIGKTVADEILALRSNDGSNATPIPFVFTNPPAPGAYQSTPPNFPKQLQFTHWPHVTPFALEHANRFRPGPPPSLTTDAYSDVSEIAGHCKDSDRDSRPGPDRAFLGWRHSKLLERDCPNRGSGP